MQHLTHALKNPEREGERVCAKGSMFKPDRTYKLFEAVELCRNDDECRRADDERCIASETREARLAEERTSCSLQLKQKLKSIAKLTQS